MPPFCFSYRLPPVCSVLPTLSPSVLCHVSTTRAENLSNLSLFHAFISVGFFPFSPCCFPYSLTPDLLLVLHIRDFIPVCPLPLSFCPVLLKSRQGSCEGPEWRQWRGARRKGCVRPQCSTLLCCAQSNTSPDAHLTSLSKWDTCIVINPVFTLLSSEGCILLVSGLSIPEHR